MYPKIVQNKQEEYNYLQQTSISWTLIRCPLLVEGEQRKYYTSETKCTGKQLTKKSLSEFIINEIRNSEYVQKCPFVFNKKND